MRIAQFTGWSFEFVEAEGDNANERALRLLEMLDNGEVDIEGSMSYSAALAETYEYPENSYGSAHTALFAPNIHAAVSKNRSVHPQRAARGHPRHRERSARAEHRVLLRSERHQPGHRRMLHHARAARQNLNRRSRRVPRDRRQHLRRVPYRVVVRWTALFFAAPKASARSSTSLMPPSTASTKATPSSRKPCTRSTSSPRRTTTI